MPETKVVGGLKWVKGELIDSLRRVRRQLEAFVAGGGASDCGDGITSLYEVRGVLLALQMTAPARLTEEMQRLLERLAAGSLANPEEAAEALMLALVQLPHYLDEVDAGRGESPVTLLPSINDLRVSRGARALSAAQLVVPSSVLSELESPTPDALKALAAVAAKVRPHFHRYLLLAFRGDGEQGLTGLGNLFYQLHRFFKEGVFCDTFRAAEAMSAGILDGGIPVTPASKAALGHIDSVFKPLLQRDPAWPEMQARQLIGELLPYLIDLDLDSALIQTLDAEYRPRRDAADGQGGRPETRHRALGADAMASLTAEVLRELAVVKDHFDLFVRRGGVAPEQVAPMEASLHQLANAMAIGEDPSLVSRFHYLADALGQLVGGELEGDDAFHLEFAQELLFLEDALRQAVPGNEGRSAGSRAALRALREARADLEKARQAIADYALDPSDLRRLRDAPDTLPGVAAALHRVGEDAAADILDGVVSLLRQRFTEGGRSPRAAELDLLAEAVAGVEMHLEGLAQGAPFGVDILSQARSALERLGSGAESRAAAELDRPGPGTEQLLAADTEAIPPVEPRFPPVSEPAPEQESEPELEPEPEPWIEVAEAAPVPAALEPVAWAIEPTAAPWVPSEAAGPTEEALPAEKEPGVWPPESVLEAEAPEDQIAAQVVPAVEAQIPAEEPPVDAALTALLLEDARDLLDRIDERLRDWQLAPEQREPLDAIQRLLHTLKGSARLSGLPAIGDLSHALESTLSAIVRGDMAVSDDALELAQRLLDTLSGQVDALDHGVPVPPADELAAALSQTQGEGVVEGAVVRLAPAAPSVTGAIRAPGTAVVAQPGAGVAQIRVRASLLDRMVNNSGEISIYRARLAQQNGTLGFSLAELDQTVGRLREQLRQLDIETEAQIHSRHDREASESDPALRDSDPLELDRFSTLQQLSRSISESVKDLVSVKNLIGDIQRESADLLMQQARIADDLHDDLLRTRMVPFVQMVPRLHRLVRQTAQALNKRATLVVRGPEVEVDRSILDRLVGPLEHLLRNAVAHGIETPRRREAAGKPAEGIVELVLSREGNDVIIVLTDDGAGMDLAAIRRRAAERGLLQGGELTDEELLQLAMEPGLSTVEKVSQIAGRGVGLDVVATEIKRLSGTLTLASESGKGAAFTMRLPLTLATIDALLVTLGDVTYAVPHASIEAVARIPRADLDQCYSGLTQEFTYLGDDYRIMHLAGLLDPHTMPDLGERLWLPLLLVRTAEQRLALQVESLIGTQRIVVKPLESQLSGVRWLNGGTILPDGCVAMILDLLALARSPAVQAYGLLRTPSA